jgi:hypothetical protein
MPHKSGEPKSAVRGARALVKLREKPHDPSCAPGGDGENGPTHQVAGYLVGRFSKLPSNSMETGFRIFLGSGPRREFGYNFEGGLT